MEISGLGFRQEILSSGQLPDAQEVSSRVIQKFDQDGDGFLSKYEMGSKADMFSEVDLDQDGLIAQNELIEKIESKMAEFGGFTPGEKPNIHQLKSMMGMMNQKISFEGGAANQQNDLFSLLDSLETSEEEKERLKDIMESNPFDVLA